MTVSRRFLEKLEAARAALSHARPGATGEEILEAGLDLVLARHAKRKGLVAKPRKVAPPSKKDHIPAHVKRAVWKTAGGARPFHPSGRWTAGARAARRCGSRSITSSHAGRAAPRRSRTRGCSAIHNQYAARQVYGDEWMDRFTRKRAEENG